MHNVNGWRKSNVNISRETTNAFERQRRIADIADDQFHDELGGATVKGRTSTFSATQALYGRIRHASRSLATCASRGTMTVRIPVGTNGADT